MTLLKKVHDSFLHLLMCLFIAGVPWCTFSGVSCQVDIRTLLPPMRREASRTRRLPRHQLLCAGAAKGMSEWMTDEGLIIWCRTWWMWLMDCWPSLRRSSLNFSSKVPSSSHLPLSLSYIIFLTCSLGVGNRSSSVSHLCAFACLQLINNHDPVIQKFLRPPQTKLPQLLRQLGASKFSHVQNCIQYQIISSTFSFINLLQWHVCSSNEFKPSSGWTYFMDRSRSRRSRRWRNLVAISGLV